MKNELSQGTKITYKLCSNIVSTLIPKKGDREHGDIKVFGLLLLLL